jgi:chorismate mutase
MVCAQEIAVPGGMLRCIRVLIHWNTEKRPNEVRHVYLHAAARLRPDRVANAARG